MPAKLTVAPVENPLPTILTGVLPAVDPALTDRVATVGGGTVGTAGDAAEGDVGLGEAVDARLVQLVSARVHATVPIRGMIPVELPAFKIASLA